MCNDINLNYFLSTYIYKWKTKTPHQLQTLVKIKKKSQCSAVALLQAVRSEFAENDQIQPKESRFWPKAKKGKFHQLAQELNPNHL